MFGVRTSAPAHIVQYPLPNELSSWKRYIELFYFKKKMFIEIFDNHIAHHKKNRKNTHNFSVSQTKNKHHLKKNRTITTQNNKYISILILPSILFY